MTAKEMAQWEGWSRKGQRRFQLVYTSFFFCCVCLGPNLVRLAMGRTGWVENFAATCLVSAGFYFVLGLVWKSKTAEYQRQIASPRDSQT